MYHNPLFWTVSAALITHEFRPQSRHFLLYQNLQYLVPGVFVAFPRFNPDSPCVAYFGV